LQDPESNERKRLSMLRHAMSMWNGMLPAVDIADPAHDTNDRLAGDLLAVQEYKNYSVTEIKQL
jgi:hypothetical protein